MAWRFPRLIGSSRPPPPPRRGYDAFISYSRKGSQHVADALRAALQRIARPWYGIGGLRIFQDRTGLGATPDLRAVLFGHIRGSNYLILLASKPAAESPWVDMELRHWFEVLKRPADKMVLVLADGDMPRWDHAQQRFDPSTTGSLAPAYLDHCRAEPAFVDLRWIDPTKPPTLKDPRFLDQVADIATPLLGKTSKDEVVSDELKQRKVLRRVGIAAAFVLVALLGTIYVSIDTQMRGTRSEAWAKRAGELVRSAPDEALLLAVAAVDAAPTSNAVETLLAATFRSAGLDGLVRGHSSEIKTLQFTGPSSLVSADSAGTVRQWALAPDGSVRSDGAPMSVRADFPPDDNGAPRKVHTTVIVPPNGQWLLAINKVEGQEDTLDATRAEMIGLAGAAPLLPPDLQEAFGYMVDMVQVSPDSSSLTFVGGIDALRRWRVGDSAQAPAQIATERCYDRLAVSRDGSTVACAGFVDDPTIIWDLGQNKRIREVPIGVDESTYLAALSDDGSVLAKPVPGGLRVVPVRDSARFVEAVYPVGGDIAALGFSPSGKLLGAALTNGRLIVLRLGGDELALEADFDMGDVQATSLAFSADDRRLAAGMKAGSIQIWTLDGRSGPLVQLGRALGFNGLAVSGDQKRVAIASTTGEWDEVRVLDVEHGDPLGEPLVFEMPIVGLGFADDLLRVIGKGPEGESCQAGGSLSTMLVTSIGADGIPTDPMIAPATRCELEGAFPTSNGIVTAAQNGLAVWRDDLGSWTVIWEQPQQLVMSQQWAVSADGTRVAFVPRLPWNPDTALEVQVWTLLNGAPQKLAQLPQGAAPDAIFTSGDGTVLAIQIESRIDLWRIDAKGTAMQIGTVEIGSNRGPAGLDTSGTRLAIMRNDGTIELWDTAGRRLIGTVPGGRPSAAVSLIFSGDYIVVADNDGSVRRFDVRQRTWVTQACKLTLALRETGAAEAILGQRLSPGICPEPT